MISFAAFGARMSHLARPAWDWRNWGSSLGTLAPSVDTVCSPRLLSDSFRGSRRSLLCNGAESLISPCRSGTSLLVSPNSPATKTQPFSRVPPHSPATKTQPFLSSSGALLRCPPTILPCVLCGADFSEILRCDRWTWARMLIGCHRRTASGVFMATSRTSRRRYELPRFRHFAGRSLAACRGLRCRAGGPSSAARSCVPRLSP